jgi:hypothetical protein
MSNPLLLQILAGAEARVSVAHTSAGIGVSTLATFS